MKKIEELMNHNNVNRVITRITHQILEKNHDLSNIGIIGMQTRGIYIAKDIGKNIEALEQTKVPIGVLDTSLYRDDYRTSLDHHDIRSTDITFDITGKDIILVDDVLYTGRTVRAALSALVDIGRPKTVQFVALIDRGRRELPIRADYIGRKLTTEENQMIEYKVAEIDGEHSVWLVETEKEEQ